MLHLYRIYQLEDVIHENLRPEKNQEVQKAGGKRKSYNLDPDNGEAPEGSGATSKKPRVKRARKGVTEAVEPGAIVGNVNVEVDTGSPLPKVQEEVSFPATGPDGGGREPKSEVVSARRGRRKKGEFVANVGRVETDLTKTARKRNKPNASGEEVGPSQVRVKRVRKRGSGIGFSV